MDLNEFSRRRASLAPVSTGASRRSDALLCAEHPFTIGVRPLSETLHRHAVAPLGALRPECPP